LLLAGSAVTTSAMAGATCADLPTAKELKNALVSVMADPNGNGGVAAPEWLTLVDTSGTVCAIVHSAPAGTDVTTVLAPIHRIFSVQKAGTANGFSRAGIGVSTSQLFMGSQHDEIASGMDGAVNPNINPYAGDATTWGTPKDPLVGKRLGSNNTEPGGLALYDSTKTKVGAIGVSGDFRCTDHVVAWKVREKLKKGAYTVANNAYGLSAAHNDAMMQDVDPTTGKSVSGYGYFKCAINNPTDANDGGAIEGN
jgi:hypothetical protein